jgi:hypothetical protein
MGATAFGDTITNPAWGRLKAFGSDLSLSSDKVTDSNGSSDQLGELTLVFNRSINLKYLGNWSLGKQFESTFFAKGIIVKSRLHSTGNDSAMNDQLADIIPESIKINHNSLGSASQLIYPFVPYCLMNLKNPDDMSAAQMNIAQAGQSLKFEETRAFRYQEAGKLVLVFNAFNWDKVNGMYIDLTCYAPNYGMSSRTDLLNLLRSIFGDKVAVAFTSK